MKTSGICLLLLVLLSNLTAQNKVLISGSVVDASNNDPLSFATVSLKRQLIGIVTNESGRFDLYIPEDKMDDTLLVSYFGYKPQAFLLKKVQSPLNIRLQQATVDLKEIVIKPQPPEFYIKLAILRAKYNYPNEPFQTEAYYREKVLENKNFLKCDEGIFKTYCPNYMDTVKNQDQLLLFRRETDLHEVEFMKKEREEAAAKERRKEEKQRQKDIKKGKTPKEPSKKNNDNTGFDVASSFGGPQSIIKQGDITKHPDGFLDTNKFDDFRYSFAKSSSYNSKELMVIDFKSKGKVEHMRSSGRIYLDAASYAFVKVEWSGDLIIPIILRPILFFYGIGIENPNFSSVVEFQQVNARWYPKHIQYNVGINLSNKHWFKPDEHSNFAIEGVFTVNKLKIEDSTPVPAAKRFNPNKDMKTQVFNDENISWSDINIIKK